MSEFLSENYVTTILFVCGGNLDFDLISQELKFSSATVIRKDEVTASCLTNDITNDSPRRLNLDRWSRTLTDEQLKWNVEKQLECWTQILHPFHKAFQAFKDKGYWISIDCQVTSKDSQAPLIQFQLTKEIQLKLSQLGLDVTFTIYT